MKTIAQKTSHEIKIQKSRFITLLYPLYKQEEIDEYLKLAQTMYPDATHYCYAYIFDTVERCFDDGEPSKTAGMPILNVLKNQQLQRTLAIVVRYFGGIKLGAGGLVRAYTNSISEALLKTPIMNLEPGYLITLTFPYEKTKEIDYACKDVSIKTKSYHNDIEYQIEVPLDQLSFITGLERLGTKIIKKEQTYIKKM